jgi:hypothetical protein
VTLDYEREPPPFAPIAPPHADFAVVWSRAGFGWVRDTFAPPCLSTFHHASCGQHVRAYTTSREISRLWSSGRCFFVGIGVSGGRWIEGPTILKGAFNEGAVNGQFAFIRARGFSLQVGTDSFGMVPLFYFRSDDLAIVSNRFHIICLILAERGLLRLDRTAFDAMFVTENAFCYQPPTFRTPAAGVRIAKQTDLFEFHPGGMRVISADSPDPPDILSPSEYRDLIAAGAAEVLANVEAAISASGASYVRAAITAGRDTRAILAAILASGKIKDVSFHTLERGRDVEIGSGLVKRFGGSYAPRGSNNLIPGTFANAVALRRSRYLGLYHHVVFRSAKAAILDGKSLSFQGGCGELYRSFYQQGSWKSEYMQQLAQHGAIVEMLTRGMAWRKLLTPQRFAAAVEAIADTFDKLAPGTIDHKLNEHYRAFRNRVHFGLSYMGFLPNNVSWTPLISPSLLRAAQGLPFEERDSGRVSFDLTKFLHEELAYLTRSRCLILRRAPITSPAATTGRI